MNGPKPIPENLYSQETVDELQVEIRNLRFKLGVFADSTDMSGMSWNGFNLLGDRKSINELRRIENRSSQMDVFYKAWEEHTRVLKDRIAELEEILNGTLDTPIINGL